MTKTKRRSGSNGPGARASIRRKVRNHNENQSVQSRPSSSQNEEVRGAIAREQAARAATPSTAARKMSATMQTNYKYANRTAGFKDVSNTGRISTRQGGRRAARGKNKSPPRTLSIEQQTMELIQLAFRNLSEGVWWRILPVEDELLDDIGVGIGLDDWEDLLPLLVHSGLLYTRMKTSVSRYYIDHYSWDTLCVTFDGGGGRRLTKGMFKDANNIRHHFLCLGQPFFVSPHKQLQAVSRKEFAFLEVKPNNH